MSQGKLKVVKQEMAGVNIDILGISELKWTGMDGGGWWATVHGVAKSRTRLSCLTFTFISGYKLGRSLNTGDIYINS